MGVKTLVSIGMAITAAVIMIALGVDNWALWTFLTFLLNYITYVGSLAALLPPIAIAFLQFPSPWIALTVAVLLSINRFVWIDYVEIRFAGRALSINAVLLLASLMYWWAFWGVAGLVLAVPMLTAAKIVLANFDTTRRWAMLISED
jgi:predicted PurR-regulated permease PerM